MGINESILKLINEPINNIIGTCGHSDCKSKCGNCLEIEIDTHAITALPALSHLQGKDISRETKDSITSPSITKILERRNENDLKTSAVHCL